MKSNRLTWILFLVAVVLAVAIAALAGARQAYGQTADGSIRCPVAIDAFQRLALSGYERFATIYINWEPVAYVFSHPASGQIQRVHCRGVSRRPRQSQVSLRIENEG